LIQTINMTKSRPGFLTSQQAADELGVGLATIYAYASRGLLTSTPDDDGGRRHRYAADDVRTLKTRRDTLRGRGSPQAVPVSWGTPVLDSELCLIVDGALYFRGVDAVRLARSARLEQAASLLWGCPDLTAFQSEQSARSPAGPNPITRCLMALALAAESDASAKARTPEARWRVGARILKLMTAAMGGVSGDAPIHRRLAAGWGRNQPSAVETIRQSLVLCAEHELNASAFTVRCAASTGASLYHAVMAGLCALTGPKHGAATVGAGKLIDELARGR
jgi:citrate synthase